MSSLIINKYLFDDTTCIIPFESSDYGNTIKKNEI